MCICAASCSEIKWFPLGMRLSPLVSFPAPHGSRRYPRPRATILRHPLSPGALLLPARCLDGVSDELGCLPAPRDFPLPMQAGRPRPQLSLATSWRYLLEEHQIP